MPAVDGHPYTPLGADKRLKIGGPVASAPTGAQEVAMRHDNPNAFTGNPLDRAGNQRRNPDWLAAQERHPDAQLLVIAEGRPLLTQAEKGARLGWLQLGAISLLPGAPELVLLGLEDGAPRYAVDATGLEESFDGLGEFASPRAAAALTSPAEAAIMGQALWLLSWHDRHRHCAKDGHRTVIADGGIKRINPETGTEHFPRTDPVAIVLPIHGDEVCLGRGPNFPEHFLSAFAGFLEPCETLEECAAREVKEETGLDVTRIEYVFSQPWPFPASLMVGFMAEVAGKELTLDPEEIAEARWCSREEVRAALNGDETVGFMPPPPFAIAHQLLYKWVNR